MAAIRTTDVAMSVEEISWKHLSNLFPDDADRAANLSGYVERVYELNPGLASQGQLIPAGTEIEMPVPESETRTLSANRLWG